MYLLRLGVLGTISSSPGAISRVMEEYARSIGKKIEIVPKVVTNAFEILSSGDRQTHDKMAKDAMLELSKKVDCIVLAQISMSLLPCEDIGVPVFKIGELGLERVKSVLTTL